MVHFLTEWKLVLKENEKNILLVKMKIKCDKVARLCTPMTSPALALRG